MKHALLSTFLCIGASLSLFATDDNAPAWYLLTQKEKYGLAAAALGVGGLTTLIHMISTKQKREDLKITFKDASLQKELFNTYTLRILASGLALAAACCCIAKACRPTTSIQGRTQKEVIASLSPLWTHQAATAQAQLTLHNHADSTALMDELNKLAVTIHDNDIHQHCTLTASERKHCCDAIKKQLGNTLKRWKAVQKQKPEASVSIGYEDTLAMLKQCHEKLPRQIANLASSLIAISENTTESK